jgi:hypothetical protein
MMSDFLSCTALTDLPTNMHTDIMLLCDISGVAACRASCSTLAKAQTEEFWRSILARLAEYWAGRFLTPAIWLMDCGAEHRLLRLSAYFDDELAEADLHLLHKDFACGGTSLDQEPYAGSFLSEPLDRTSGPRFWEVVVDAEEGTCVQAGLLCTGLGRWPVPGDAQWTPVCARLQV